MEKIIGGVKRECYPLTPAQIVHIGTMLASSSDEVVNIGTGQYLRYNLNIAALREALNRAVERCETMRMRIWKDPETNEMWQYILPYENQFFEYYDFSEWSEDKVHEVLDKWTSQPFDTFSGPLSRIVIVSLPNGYNGYYFNVHHCCMDSGSVIAFTKDVMDIYCYLMFGLPYPKPMTSYIESIKKDFEYEGSKKQQKDREYWQKKLFESEPMYTDFTGPGRLQTLRMQTGNPNQRWGLLHSSDSAGNTVTYRLDVESTMKLIRFSEEYGVPVSAVILNAIRTVLSKFNNNETDVTIKNFVSRRSTVLQKKCGGVRMHCLPLRTIIPLDTKVIDAINIIKDEQQRMFIHADYPTTEYYAQMRKHYNVAAGGGYESIGFTYQPATMKSLIPYLKGIETYSRWYSSGKQAQPLYITAMHRQSDGGLNFYFGYQTELATKEEIEFLYYFLGRVLFRCIENPDKTIQDIIDMT